MNSIIDTRLRILSEGYDYIAIGNEISKEKTQIESVGTFFNKRDKLFLVLSNHSILTDSNIYIILDTIEGDAMIPLNEYFYNYYEICEIDTLVIHLNRQIMDDYNTIFEGIEIVNIDDIDFNLRDVDDNIYSFLCPYNEGFKKLNCKINQFIDIRYNNPVLPEMPVFLSSLLEEDHDFFLSEIKSFEGISGSLVFNGENIIGIHSGINEDTLVITPLILINNVLNQINLYNSFTGFCKFYVNTKIVDDEMIVVNNVMSYNIYSKIGFLLNKHDVIYSLDGIEIDDNGFVLDPQLNIPISINHYILFNKSINEINKFYIKRSKNVKKTHYYIQCGNRDITSCLNVNIRSEPVFYSYRNKVYAKICPKLIDFIKKYRNFTSVNIESLISTYSDGYKNDYILLFDNDKNYSLFRTIDDNLKVKNISNKHIDSCIEICV